MKLREHPSLLYSLWIQFGHQVTKIAKRYLVRLENQQLRF